MRHEFDSTEMIDLLIRRLKDNLGQRGRVRQTLAESLTVSEIKDLAFDLNIDYEDLPAETKSGLLRELILKGRREGRLGELFQHLFELHPHIKSKLTDPDIVSAFGDVLAKDEYARLTLERSLAEPQDDNRTRALAGVIAEAVGKDKMLLEMLNDLADAAGRQGDIINQEMKIDDASGSDIVQIGKVVNTETNNLRKKKRRKWLFF